MTNTYNHQIVDAVSTASGKIQTELFGDMDASEAARLGGYAALIEAAQTQLALEVETARSMGESWEQIGNALGISRQAAWERFSPSPQKKG